MLWLYNCTHIFMHTKPTFMPAFNIVIRCQLVYNNINIDIYDMAGIPWKHEMTHQMRFHKIIPNYFIKHNTIRNLAIHFMGKNIQPCGLIIWTNDNSVPIVTIYNTPDLSGYYTWNLDVGYSKCHGYGITKTSGRCQRQCLYSNLFTCLGSPNYITLQPIYALS